MSCKIYFTHATSGWTLTHLRHLIHIATSTTSSPRHHRRGPAKSLPAICHLDPLPSTCSHFASVICANASNGPAFCPSQSPNRVSWVIRSPDTAQIPPAHDSIVDSVHPPHLTKFTCVVGGRSAASLTRRWSCGQDVAWGKLPTRLLAATDRRVILVPTRSQIPDMPS